MAVNIDEGEPGTFKDRVYLERDPHRFLEGMLIAAWAVGIESIYIYLRDEYHGCRAHAGSASSRSCGRPAVAGCRSIELRRGAGAYICGEESAMIESIEGKRGMPRLRPPYVAQVGLFGRPDAGAQLRDAVLGARHPREGRATGSPRTAATAARACARSRCRAACKNPGVKLAPAGITIQELIDEYCGGMQDGHEFYAYLPGGASGGILPATMNDIPLDFDTLQPYGCFIGSAAVIVLSDHDTRDRRGAQHDALLPATSPAASARPAASAPPRRCALIEQPRWDVPLLADLSQVMRDASICGLGQAAPNPVDCVVKYFPHELT